MNTFEENITKAEQSLGLAVRDFNAALGGATPLEAVMLYEVLAAANRMRLRARLMLESRGAK